MLATTALSLLLATAAQAETTNATSQTPGRTPQTAAAPAYPPGPRAPAGAPNVLIIMTDDVGFGASSTFGGPIPTPTFTALGDAGLRYNRFHTNALCSPTRAALLTGRNPHNVGTGALVDLSTGYPGYNSILPQTARTFAEVLKRNGYSTSWFGKNHNTPQWEVTPIGPYERWPIGLGFEKFYGFHGGKMNQWEPVLYDNTNPVEPARGKSNYHLDVDMADQAIDWIRVQNYVAPEKPFLMYYAPATAHAPHHAPKEWIEKFKGKFDQGWDKMREETFARQKALGVIPKDAVLTPRPEGMPAWDSLTAEQKAVGARLMEVYAANLAFCDEQIGRIIQALKDSGQYDNTLIIYIQGDNGASGEGGLSGTTGRSALNGMTNSMTDMLAVLDQVGGPATSSNYPAGWAWAMNTPFQWMKQIASHLGGTRTGVTVTWPSRIEARGEVRSQFVTVMDIAPTLYEVIGIEPPAVIDGVGQQPIDGASFAASFQSAKAPEPDRPLFYEVFGSRSLYDDGWMLSSHPTRMPWQGMPTQLDPDAVKWELYDLRKDYSQARNVAAKYPTIVARMRGELESLAAANNVYPYDLRTMARATPEHRPSALGGRKLFRLYPMATRLELGAVPTLSKQGWTIRARVEAGEASKGVIAAEGGDIAGWALLMIDGKPSFVYRLSPAQSDLIRIEGPRLSQGAHNLEVRYVRSQAGPEGTAELMVDGVVVGSAVLPRGLPHWQSVDGLSIGYDSSSPIVSDYRTPFAFNGKIAFVEIELAEPLPSAPH